MISIEEDDNYNSFIEISNIIDQSIKRKLKSYNLYDIDSNRKKNYRSRDNGSSKSYNNLSMKRSKTCAGNQYFYQSIIYNILINYYINRFHII